MPRKPLTDDQLEACLKAGGHVCPRCGNEDKGDMDDDEIDFDDDGNPFVVFYCLICREEWVVTYKAIKVGRPEED